MGKRVARQFYGDPVFQISDKKDSNYYKRTLEQGTSLIMIDDEKCPAAINCAKYIKICPTKVLIISAISNETTTCRITSYQPELCNNCGACVKICLKAAITVNALKTIF